MTMLPPYTPQPYLPPPPPTPKRSNVGRMVVICGSILALTAFAGVVATNGSASTPATTATTASAPSSTTTTVPMTTTTSKSQAMAAWGKQAMPALTGLSHDMTDAGEAAGDTDVAALRAACSSMTSNVRAVRALLPTPDAEMTDEVTAALDDFDISASSCITFTRTFDSSAGQRTATYLVSGGRHIKNATDLLDKY